MFGFLKKKLKEGIEKITKKVEKEEQVQERTKEKLQKPKKVAKEKPKKVKKSLFNIGKRIIRESDIKDVLWDLQISLLESDVALETAEKICNDLKKNLVGKEIKKKDMEITIRNTLKNSLKEILDQKQIDILAEVKKKKPFLILFLGFNGAGKTTAIARVEYLLKRKGLSVN
ncbi:MAG: signal recognition particle-docking protein FtsY, partial [Thermoplasmata archaeon]